MPNNREIVDKCVDILGGLYGEILKKHGLKGNVDFSGLAEIIMPVLEQETPDKINEIIDGFVNDKIIKYDAKAGEEAIKIGIKAAQNHRRTVDDLIGFSKKYNRMCAEAIEKNVIIEQKKEKEEPQEAEEISIEEAMRRNAQAVFNKTGHIPDGYSVDENGKVMRDATREENSSNDEQDIAEEKLNSHDEGR